MALLSAPCYGSFMIEIDPRYDYFQEYQYDMNKRGLRLDNWLLHMYQAGRFLRWLWDKKMDLPDVTSDVLSDYLRHRRDKGHRYSTLIQIMTVLRDFFNFAVRDQLINENPITPVSLRWLDIPGGFAGYHGALKRFLKDPYFIWKFRLPLFAPYWESYLNRLVDQGYTKRSLFHVLERNFYFHDYLARKKVKQFSSITRRLLKTYLLSKQRHFQKKWGRPINTRYLQGIRATLTHFLTYAFGQQGRFFIPLRGKNKNSVMSDDLLDRYDHFCQIHQGLSPVTRDGYRRALLLLRSYLDRRGVHHLKQITLSYLDNFLVKQTSRYRPRGLQSLVTAMRSFFRYLHLNGDIATDLAQGFISPSRFRSDLRPKYFPWEKIQQFLASIDRSHRVGKRDYAILMLLACHGLRAREVAKLRLADIDYDNHALFLRHRKNDTAVHMPLSVQTEEALRDYVAVRSVCSAPEIFLTEVAPMGPLGKGVSGVAQRHLHKFFGPSIYPSGAYTLRHSFAKALLDRGASLHDVGALLGQRSLRSTLIYSRIAIRDMREVADNYADLL